MDYSAIMNDIKSIMTSVDGTQVCNLGASGCTVFGPMPAFNIDINDGTHYYSLSIQLGSWDDNDYITTISLMEGGETRLTIPSENLSDEYITLYNFIYDAYIDYTNSTE